VSHSFHLTLIYLVLSVTKLFHNLKGSEISCEEKKEEQQTEQFGIVPRQLYIKSCLELFSGKNFVTRFLLLTLSILMQVFSCADRGKYLIHLLPVLGIWKINFLFTFLTFLQPLKSTVNFRVH